MSKHLTRFFLVVYPQVEAHSLSNEQIAQSIQFASQFLKNPLRVKTICISDFFPSIQFADAVHDVMRVKIKVMPALEFQMPDTPDNITEFLNRNPGNLLTILHQRAFKKFAEIFSLQSNAEIFRLYELSKNEKGWAIGECPIR